MNGKFFSTCHCCLKERLLVLLFTELDKFLAKLLLKLHLVGSCYCSNSYYCLGHGADREATYTLLARDSCLLHIPSLHWTQSLGSFPHLAILLYHPTFSSYHLEDHPDMSPYKAIRLLLSTSVYCHGFT